MRAEPDALAGHEPYLAGLRLTGRPVIVIGAGVVAARRIPRLLAAGAELTVVAPEATPAVEAMADAGELQWLRRTYAAGDLRGAWYALACTDSEAVNSAVLGEAETERVFCVRADAAAHGSAVTTAVGSHDGLTVGVLSGGRPRRSVAVRDAVLEALRAGRIDDAAEAPAPGVALVGGGPGDPDLITVRGRRMLARAHVVVADRLAPRALLEELGSDVELIDAAKIPYGRSASQQVINAALIEHVRAGKFVVRLKGGDPFVFGRGFEEVIACAQAGVAVTVVPGISSAFAVPAVEQVPVTHRGVAHEVVVVSGHVAPEDPSSLVDWQALGRLSGTLVLMMGLQRIGAFADALMGGGRAADTPVQVIQDGTTTAQRAVRSTLADVERAVHEAGLRPPAIVVIGPVAALADDIDGP